MITEIPRKGTSVAGLLHYLGGPHRTDARLLDTNLGGETHEDWTRQFESLVHHHAPRQNRIAKQMILSAAPEDRISKEQWREIVELYRERMGYAEAPFVAYLHSDPRRQHVHIVTTPTTWDGKRVSESWDWPRSEAVAREIERRWQLRAVQPSKEVRDKAPTHGEWRKTGGADAVSVRRQFQREIRAIGERSRSVDEYFDGLRRAGFTVRVQEDSKGEIRGLTYERGGFAFRGSQLGRDFKASTFERAFGLSQDSRAIRALKALALATDQKLVEAFGGPRPEALATARADHRARVRLEGALRQLLPGRYGIESVRPEPHGGSTFDPREARVVHRLQGQTPGDLLGRVGELAEWNRHADLLIRPAEPGSRYVSLRDLRQEQLGRMVSEGVRPAWVVRSGESFEALLRLPRGESPTTAWHLRRTLVERFSLADQHVKGLDTVHLPGSTVHGAARSEPVSWQGREETAEPVPERFVREARERPESQEVQQRADLLRLEEPRMPELRPSAAVALTGSPWGGLQEAAESRRQEPGPASRELAALPADELARAALAESRRAVEVRLSQPGDGESSSARWLDLEGEAERRLRTAWNRAQTAERELPSVQRRIEALSGEASQAPTLERLAEYRQAMAHSVELAEQRDQASAEVGRWFAVQGVSNSQRLAGSLAGDQTEAALHRLANAVYDQVVFEVAASARFVVDPVVHDDRRPRSKEDLQEELEHHFRQLGRLGLESAFRLADVLRELYLVQVAEDRQPGLGPGPKAPARDPGEVGSLRLAVRQAARPEQTSQSLRPLTEALVRHDQGRTLTLPTYPEPASHAEAQARLLAALERTRELAARLAPNPAGAPVLDRARLLQAASEALFLERRLHAFERQALSLASPEKVPQGLSRLAWQTAWVGRAVEKGLPVERAAQHLAALALPGDRGAAAAVAKVVSLALEVLRQARAAERVPELRLRR